MRNRFIIKYCSVLDSVFLIDTKSRMPETRIHNSLSVHGLDCNDRERAEERQKYYENLFGFQRPLFQEVTSFELRSHKHFGFGFHDADEYVMVYDVFDNTGRHIIRSTDKVLAVEFKEWLEQELKQ